MREGEKRGPIGRRTTNPYFEDHKYPEPTECPRCHLVYRNGRWQTGEIAVDENAQRSPCPACRREADRYPGGLVTLRGEYLRDHHQEILNIARNQATAAARSRPLQRIMWIEDDPAEGTTEIATTNSHLAVRIGKAIVGACKGQLDVKRASEDQLARVYWERGA
ncbi:MAG: ATPase [Candidatus Bipolaricaulota bacterium]|nr:MAG: ATPase [Candidatus Bipolaricaulota bacterium]